MKQIEQIMTLEHITTTQKCITTIRETADEMADTLVQQCADYIITQCNNRGGEWLFECPIKFYERSYKGFRIRRVESHSGEFPNDKSYYMCIEALERWDSIEKEFSWQYCDYLDFEGQHLLGKPNQTSSYVGLLKTYFEIR